MALPTDQEIIQAAIETAASYGNPRCAFIEKALDVGTRNLAYANPETRQAYINEAFFEGVFPKNPDGSYQVTDAQANAARQMAASMSACGIFTEAIWRYAGVDAPYLTRFYHERMGSAVGAEYTFAKSVGAWVSAEQWRRGTPFPEGGDAMIIGNDTPAYARGVTNYQHELNVIAWVEGPKGALMASVDGGQPGVAIRTRGLVEVWTGPDVGELWCGAVAQDGSIPLGSDGRPAQGRRVLGFTDVSKLPFKPGMPPSCKAGGGAIGRAASKAGGVLVGALVAVSLAGAIAKGVPWVINKLT